MLTTMENFNNYLIIILALMVFYLVLMMYLKHNKQNFSPVNSRIPDIVNQPSYHDEIQKQPDVYLTEDTRMSFPALAPVNHNAKNRIIENIKPASPLLYSTQPYDTNYYLLDTPPDILNTNELLYSGGETQLIKIPLQYNSPTNEQLRSQDILVTPYNKIKYFTC